MVSWYRMVWPIQTRRSVFVAGYTLDQLLMASWLIVGGRSTTTTWQAGEKSAQPLKLIPKLNRNRLPIVLVFLFVDLQNLFQNLSSFTFPSDRPGFSTDHPECDVDDSDDREGYCSNRCVGLPHQSGAFFDFPKFIPRMLMTL